MLPRAALRIAQARSSVAPFSSIRGYASQQPDSTTIQKGNASQASYGDVKGPIKNTTWGPRSTFNPSASLIPSTDPPKPKTPRVTISAQQPRRFSTALIRPQASPRDGPNSPSPLGRPATGASRQDAESEKGDYSVQQPEFESAASPTKGKDPEVESSASFGDLPSDEHLLNTQRTQQDAEAPIEPEIPQGPLPDLRQGIPSTFGQDVSDRSSSFKDQDAEQPSLNLTEDPTKPADGQQQRGELPREAYISSIERRRNKTANYMYGVAAVLLIGGATYLGWDDANDEEARLHPDLPQGWAPSAFYARMSTRLSQSLGYYTEPVFPKLLPEMDATMKPPHTLVLSLEDLLVHSKWNREGGWQVAKRPGLDYFIRYLSQYYELVIFTTVPSMNGEMVYRKLDPYRLIMFPLFREATRYMNGEHVKDLSYLNRDLSKTLIIDTNPAHTRLQPENAIILPKWSGTPQDKHAPDLVAMIPFLEFIATMAPDDVRKTLKSYAGTHIPTEYARREALAREAHNKRRASGGTSRRTASGGMGMSSMLGFKSQPAPGAYPGEPSVAEGLAQGKMMSDIIRERGRRQYEVLEAEIKMNGSRWLEEQAAEEKKMMEEATRNMQGNPLGFFGQMFGGAAAAKPVGAEGGDGKR